MIERATGDDDRRVATGDERRSSEARRRREADHQRATSTTPSPATSNPDCNTVTSNKPTASPATTRTGDGQRRSRHQRQSNTVTSDNRGLMREAGRLKQLRRLPQHIQRSARYPFRVCDAAMRLRRAMCSKALRGAALSTRFSTPKPLDNIGKSVERHAWQWFAAAAHFYSFVMSWRRSWTFAFRTAWSYC